MRRLSRLSRLAALAIALMPALAQAGGLVGVRALSRQSETPLASAVSLEQRSSGAQLVFTMTAPVAVSAYVLDEPARVIVDLPETGFVLDPAAGRATSLSSGLVRAFRFGAQAPGKSRIVIDLSGPARILRAESDRTAAGGAFRLVVDLAPTDSATFRTAAAEARRVMALAAEPPAPDPQRPVVVLDPGHGGTDLGATAKDVAEKNIVFDFAKALQARLDKGGEVRTVLTRSDDTFVPLGERVRFAENANASLFVSIHADHLSETSVQGATVYTLSDRASDAHAARVAENENASDKVGGVVDKAEAAGLSDILSDLTRRETKVLGRSFARGLVSAWRDVGELNKNPLRSAGFRVLKAADFPSVLFELGYLSNVSDLKSLTSPEWREKAVEKVAAAIERFLRTQPREPTAVVASGGAASSTTR